MLGRDQLVSQNRGGTTSYYLHDGQQSVRALANSGGSITDRYSYNAYGQLQVKQGTTTNAYLYTGQRFDAQTALYQLRARYYMPQTGRFLNRDSFPVLLNKPIEMNRYAYATNNPINMTDPTGRSIFVDFIVNTVLAVEYGMPGAIAAYRDNLIAASVYFVAAACGACGSEKQKWAAHTPSGAFILGWASRAALGAPLKIVHPFIAYAYSTYNFINGPLTNFINNRNPCELIPVLMTIRSLSRPLPKECLLCLRFDYVLLG